MYFSFSSYLISPKKQAFFRFLEIFCFVVPFIVQKLTSFTPGNYPNPTTSSFSRTTSPLSQMMQNIFATTRNSQLPTPKPRIISLIITNKQISPHNHDHRIPERSLFWNSGNEGGLPAPAALSPISPHGVRGRRAGVGYRLTGAGVYHLIFFDTKNGRGLAGERGKPCASASSCPKLSRNGHSAILIDLICRTM